MPADVTDPSPVVALDVGAAGARALAAGDKLGEHYRIARLLGAGGMGEVYLAHDSRLERDVAIKVVRPTLAGGAAARDRLVAEARAMARLRHPNAVAVHEVGTIGDQVFIAMEYVDGPTLRAWLAGKPAVAIVRAFAACAGALAAAHRAGIVHGDFKPDNVLVGSDGRVRVADFGLAHTGDTAPRGGTPAFMAPELVAGGAATAASDQYALCVALRDALGGKLARVAPVVARGTASAPADRYPSIDTVAAVLARDPAVRRTRVALGAVAIAAVAGAGIFGFARGRAGPAPCEDAGGELAGAWDDSVAATASAHFHAAGFAYADDAFARVRGRLDDYAAAWTAMRREACVATAVRGEQSEAVRDLRMQCLDRRRAELAALTAHLAGDAKLDHAIDAARGLPAIADCADTAMLGAIAPPPVERRVDVAALTARLTDVRVRIRLGGYPGTREAATALVDDARRIDYPPLLAAALIAVGDVATTSEPKAAEAAYREAVPAASKGRDDDAAARAWIGLYATAVVLEQKLDEEPELEAGATAAVARAGDPAALRVRLLLRIAEAAHRKGNLDVASKRLDDATALLADGTDPANLASALAIRALVLRDRGDIAGARATARDALAQGEKAFGPKHPSIVGTLASLARLAQAQGDLDDADALLRRGLAIDEDALGKDSFEVARLLTARATLLEARHQLDDARDALVRALAIKQRVLGVDHREVANTYLNLSAVAFDRDDYAEARDAAGKAIAIYTAKLGDHAQTAQAVYDLANVDQMTGRYADARAEYQRAIAIDRKVRGDPADLADALTQLATTELADHHPDAALDAANQAIAARGKDDATAVTLAAQALADRGDRAGAEVRYRDALKLAEAASADSPLVIEPLLGLGRLLTAQRPAEAIALLERALAVTDASHDAAVDRVARADVRLALAQALVGSGGDRARTSALAREARDLVQPIADRRPAAAVIERAAAKLAQ